MPAVIFDMDGVISDTQITHADVESRLLQEVGVVINPDEVTKRFAGVTNREWFGTVLAEQNKSADVDQLIARKWEMIADPNTAIQGMPGIRELLEYFLSRGYSLAVGSSSRSNFIQHVLSVLDLNKYFQAIASADEVAHGKPDPAVFLLAAKKLGVDPKECTVIEDGESGMIAAKHAGMHCIALIVDPKRPTESLPTDHVVTKLQDIPRLFEPA